MDMHSWQSQNSSLELHHAKNTTLDLTVDRSILSLLQTGSKIMMGIPNKTFSGRFPVEEERQGLWNTSRISLAVMSSVLPFDKLPVPKDWIWNHFLHHWCATNSRMLRKGTSVVKCKAAWSVIQEQKMNSESCIELRPGEYLPKVQFSKIWDSFISQSQPNDSYLCCFIYVKINTSDSDGLVWPHVSWKTHTHFSDIS